MWRFITAEYMLKLSSQQYHHQLTTHAKTQKHLFDTKLRHSLIAPFSIGSSCLLQEQSRLVPAVRRSAVRTRLCIRAKVWIMAALSYLYNTILSYMQKYC
jgi:hypothetical protein